MKQKKLVYGVIGVKSYEYASSLRSPCVRSI